MKSEMLTPLSASALADYEREAKHLRASASFGGVRPTEGWAMRFLRLLALHRATERQSVLLQSQVRTLEADNLKLEAALEAAQRKSHD